jgi:hypothetical protein
MKPIDIDMTGASHRRSDCIAAREARRRCSDRLRTTGVLALLLSAQVIAPACAGAQPFDHLKCFKVRDAAKFVATATIEAALAQFGNESCQIKGRAKLFCVPADKTVTAFTDKSQEGIPPTGYAGQDLTDARVCYRIKCPKSEIAPETATDQFGTRSFEKFKSQLLCTPAVLGTPPTTTTTTLPTCDGGSPWPTCSGDCSSIGPTYACEARDDMTCACVRPCAELDPGQGAICSHGGGCPVDSRCDEILGVCTCVFSPSMVR